ncbi:hypothetical protein J6590_094475 [Homalodisca vitripennis]|nr:hypothetical protein J6590_094475 [Homalodisca vitripennis]
MARWPLLVVCLLMMSVNYATARPDLLGGLLNGLLGGLLGGILKNDCLKKGGEVS